jgi:Fe-S cluster biogenesis protein NfuA
MPIVTAVMSTPNPLANKFMIDAPLFSGPPRHFSAGARVVGDALGEDLLAVPGVVELYCTGEFVTVTRDPGTPWSAIEASITALIEGHKPKRVIDIAGPSGVASAAAPGAHGAASVDEAPVEAEADDPELLMRINMILDEHIRPFLDKDGGGLDVLKLKDFTLTVRYKGACGGCPSASTGTLFAINNLLQNYVDDRLLVEPTY